MTGRVLVPVGLIQRLVLDGDVGRVADDAVVAAAQNGVEPGLVLDLEVVRQAVVEGVTLDALPLPLVPRAVQQGVADGEVQVKVRRILEGCGLAMMSHEEYVVTI